MKCYTLRHGSQNLKVEACSALDGWFLATHPTLEKISPSAGVGLGDGAGS